MPAVGAAEAARCLPLCTGHQPCVRMPDPTLWPKVQRYPCPSPCPKQLLFATETFSTGLNMPAKTVVFTHARKFDGSGFRWVSSGEYIQMSGRAGRRGKDDKGVVILLLDSKMEPATAKDMIKGAPDTLYSEFHLGYNMLLNILRTEGTAPEELMRRSYRQFQTERALPALEAQAAALEVERNGVVVQDEPRVQEYLALEQQLRKLRGELRHTTVAPRHSLPFLQPGRLVQVQLEGQDGQGGGGAGPAWGAVVNFERVGGGANGSSANGSCEGTEGAGGKDAAYLVDVLVNCAPDSAQPNSNRWGAPLLLPLGGCGMGPTHPETAPSAAGIEMLPALKLSSLKWWSDPGIALLHASWSCVGLPACLPACQPASQPFHRRSMLAPAGAACPSPHGRMARRWWCPSPCVKR